MACRKCPLPFSVGRIVSYQLQSDRKPGLVFLDRGRMIPSLLPNFPDPVPDERHAVLPAGVARLLRGELRYDRQIRLILPERTRQIPLLAQNIAEIAAGIRKIV